MIHALMVSLLVVAPPGATTAAAQSDDPPIKVWLNQDNYFLRGDRARVNVKPAEDGYLVVLRADADGRVRVLFPLDPGDDAFVRGGRKIEVRGRGDRTAFSIDDREGSGLVLAARSASPFKFDEFVRGDHWDYGALSSGETDRDKEQALVDIVQRMATGSHFDYDVVSYTVASSRDYYYPRYSRLSYGYGWPYYRSGFYSNACFDPFWSDPFFCGSFYDPFFYGYGYSRYYYDPFFYGPRIHVYRPYVYQPYYRPRYAGGLFIDRVRGGSGGGLRFRERTATPPTVLGVAPRLRIPQGTLLLAAEGRRVPGSAPAAVPVRVRDRAFGDREALAPGRREPEARPADRRDSGRWERPAPERREGERSADRPPASRGRESGGEGGGGGGGGRRVGGGGGGGGGGGSSAGRASGSSGSGRSAPSNGSGRRR